MHVCTLASFGLAPDSHAQSRARLQWCTSVDVPLSLSPHRVPSRQSYFFPLPSVLRVQFSQLYASADTVVILEAVSLRLVRSLAFSQVFPGRDHADSHITSIAVDSPMKLVRTSYSIASAFHFILRRLVGGHGIRPEACRLGTLWGLCSHLARPLVTPSS